MTKCFGRAVWAIGNDVEPPQKQFRDREVQLPFDAPYHLMHVLELQKGLVEFPTCPDCAFTSNAPDISRGCMRITSARSYLTQVVKLPSAEIKILAENCEYAISSGRKIEDVVKALQTVIDAVIAFAANYQTLKPEKKRCPPIDISIFGRRQTAQKIAADMFNSLYPDGKPIHMTDRMVDDIIVEKVPRRELSPPTFRRLRKQLPGGCWPVARCGA